MPNALFILIGCELIGEILRRVFDLPVPGPVIGMFLLAAGFARRDRIGPPDAGAAPSALARTADALIQHMGLLFVPAGVGIIAEAGLLRREWLPIVAAVLGSTILSLAATGLVMHRLGRRVEESRAAPASVAAARAHEARP